MGLSPAAAGTGATDLSSYFLPYKELLRGNEPMVFRLSQRSHDTASTREGKSLGLNSGRVWTQLSLPKYLSLAWNLRRRLLYTVHFLSEGRIAAADRDSSQVFSPVDFPVRTS